MRLGVLVFIILTIAIQCPRSVIYMDYAATDADSTPLSVLKMPPSLNLPHGGLNSIEVVVGNSGEEPLNVTLKVEQDRSPHEALPVEPLPTAMIDPDSNATLILTLRGVVWIDDVISPYGEVKTAIFITAITIDSSLQSSYATLEVHLTYMTIAGIAPPVIVIGLFIVLGILALIRFIKR